MLRRTFLLGCGALAGAAAQTLRVMSFNVRYPAKGDGPNIWENRRDIMVAAIREKDPDLLGTQELYYEQGCYLAQRLPQYQWFGLSRRGNHEDEHMGVFYKWSRLKRIDEGNFWLSESPEAPGSMSWNVNLPRMVTWALFELRDTGRRFYYYNTHFPHRREDEPARLRAAKLIAERIRALPPNLPFILTGDFNAPAGGAVYKVFADLLKDAWHEAPRRSGPEGTFNGFQGRGDGPRIDWILFRGELKVREAETVTFHQEGRYPSDHFPVFAVFELP